MLLNCARAVIQNLTEIWSWPMMIHPFSKVLKNWPLITLSLARIRDVEPRKEGVTVFFDIAIDGGRRIVLLWCFLGVLLGFGRLFFGHLMLVYRIEQLNGYRALVDSAVEYLLW